MSDRISYQIYSEPSPDSATLFQALLTALSDAYAAIDAEIRVDGFTTAFLHLYWTKGDETSIEVKAEFALREGGTTSQEIIATATSSLGITTVKIREYTFSTATDNIIIPIRLQGRFLNLYIKATGGTPTGTYGAGLHLVRE